MQDAKQRFAQKLRDSMQAQGYEARPAVLEHEFNSRFWGKPMSQHGVRLWLLGKTMPNAKKLAALADWLQVPLEEFLRSPQQVREVREPKSAWSAGLGYEDSELFKIYLRLPVPKRRLARDVILAIARAHDAEEAERAAGS
ncbi:XRE family transcriptional regulator [Delftia acidovorans]